jgi:hypothetical protein
MITGEQDLSRDRGVLMIRHLSRERELDQSSSCMIIGGDDLDRERLRVVGLGTRMVCGLRLRDRLDS